VTNRNLAFFVLASGFVVLGMSLTVPGVAWPSVAESFDRSLAELGYVTLLFGGGYTVSTLLSGRLSAKAGIGPILIASAATAAFALVALSTSGTWPIYLIATGLLGIAGGLADAATNTYVAIRRGARSMGILHGSFGIGAIAGPLLVAVLLAAGQSWRVAFALLAVGQGVYALGLWRFARNLDVSVEAIPREHRADLLRSSVLVWSLVVFFVYMGIAAGTGIWAFTFLTEERGINDGLSALIVAAYWGGFTASRFVLGAVGDRFRPDTVLRWSAAATAAALMVFWWNPANWLGAVALVCAGFAHGPIFPLEMLLTPRRFGAALTATVVGFEIAVGNIGGAVLPGGIGFAVGRSGLAVIPPLLVINALVLWVTIEMLRRQSLVAMERKDASRTKG
jgi:fucose permease